MTALHRFAVPLVFFSLLPFAAGAQDSYLQDYNGDGRVSLVAFGDSITRGVGDFIAAGQDVEQLTFPTGEAGYPLRVEQLLGVPVVNRGVPGERISEDGMARFVSLVTSSRSDLAIVSEGVNDSFSKLGPGAYFRTLQIMLNAARASGTKVLLGTIITPCCDHVGLRPFVDAYNAQISRAGALNDIPVADIQRAFRNTCDVDNCRLLNLPDGLHPNIEGYDVMGEAIAASLLKIDLFSPRGASELEQALDLSPGSVQTKPDPGLGQ